MSSMKEIIEEEFEKFFESPCSPIYGTVSHSSCKSFAEHIAKKAYIMGSDDAVKELHCE